MNIGTERLIGHLGIRNARLLMTTTLSTSGDQLSLYAANGRTFVVQIFADGGGFEVYTPVTPSLSIDTTLAKLDEYIAATI